MDKHRISPEPDRSAYEAGKNILRLHNYRQQLEHLGRMKIRVIHELNSKHGGKHRLENIQAAIKAAQLVLNSGQSVESALALAEAYLEEASRAAD